MSHNPNNKPRDENEGASEVNGDVEDDDFLMKLVASRARGVALEEAVEAAAAMNNVEKRSAEHPTISNGDEARGKKNQEDIGQTTTAKIPDTYAKEQGSRLPAVGISLEAGHEDILQKTASLRTRNDSNAAASNPNLQPPGAYAIGGTQRENTTEEYSAGVDNNTLSREEEDEELGGIEPRPEEPRTSAANDDTTSSSHLVEAHPAVSAEDLAQAEPVEIRPSGHGTSKKVRCCFLLVVVAAVLIGIAIVALVVTKQQESSPDIDSSRNEGSTSNDTESSEMPSMSDEVLQAILQKFQDSLPEYTLESLQDPFSPQSQAYHWLFDQQYQQSTEEGYLDIRALPLWRHRQLFALATYYYASDGEKWPLGINLDWLDLSKGRTECDWFSTNNGEFFVSDGSFGETGANLYADSCNDLGEFQSLYLTHGGLFGSSMENAKMPAEISFLTSMKHIILGHGGITNTTLQNLLPKQIFYHLSKLQTLLYFTNDVTGTIPTELGLLKQLTGLGLQDMSLSGTIPSELGQATQLQMIGFAYNPNLEGTVPSELWALPQLTSVDFAHCNLTGTLPDEGNTSATQFQHLNLNDNDFSGPIPRNWGASSSLLHLNLGANTRLTGSIPESLCQLNDSGCYQIHPAWGTNASCLLNVTCNDQLCGCGCDACAP